jgi:predicted metal-dependent phosphoesterase TrpH
MNGTPRGLYTKNELDYVESIKDEELRIELLYQIRLRNNMEYDRDSFENENNTLKNTIIEIKELYPDIIIPNKIEINKKYGELSSFLNKYRKHIRLSKINKIFKKGHQQK